MAAGSITADSVDYLQRRTPPPEQIDLAGVTGAPATRRLLRVRGIGRRDKQAPVVKLEPKERWRPRTTELLTGLYGYRIPFAFLLTGAPGGLEVQLGTWSARDGEPERQDRRRDVVSSVLGGLYPVVDLAAGDGLPQAWPLSGLALGVPAPSGIDPADGGAPVDRIVRAMTGTSWAVLVLAHPASEQAVAGVRGEVLGEMRAVTSAAKSEGAESPVAEQYVGLLKNHLESLAEGLSTGAWRTAVYLLGDAESYPRLATAWRSVFAGPSSLPEPARVFDRPEAAALAAAWTLPDAPAPPGPGVLRRPFELQTLLTTAQLASYAHLPELETPGFAIDAVPRFDAVPAGARADGAARLGLGRITHQRRDTGAEYTVTLKSLTRHAFVAGLTGSGKTNTILSLLEQADAAGVPFLVVEPAKAEYRALLDHPRLGDRVRVFTAGRASVAPLLLNPFQVPEGTAVSEHIDLVRAAFGAAFGMWTPLPQLLERCLHAVYADRGWNLRTNVNARLEAGGPSTDAFPTLSDLVAKVAEVLPTLGYEERVEGDLRAALTTRLDALRIGGKGAMLDVARSLPVGELLAGPTVLELEPMGDEGDKAFLMAMVLILLAEHRRTMGQSPELVHLLVVEEAHRLLANVAARTSEESADPRGQAVEAFTNLLSEIRAYGQGVVIADQVPVRLAPDVIKNTNLKLAHRIVALDDREALGGAMAMAEPQTRALTTLGVGEAAVFSTGDDEPLMIRVPAVKDALGPPPADEVVADRMASWRARSGMDVLLQPRPFCGETCADAPQACEAARRLLADASVQRALARTVLSLADESGALDRLWDDLVSTVRARRPPRVEEGALVRAFAGHGADWYAQRRGTQGAWSFADTAELGDRLRAALVAQVEGRAAPDAREAFRAAMARLHARRFEPYPVCADVCRQDPPLCLYRSAVADLVAERRYQPTWAEADRHDATSGEDRRAQTWEVCQDAAFELIEFPDPEAPPEVNDRLAAAARRAGLCFAQQMLAADDRKLPRTTRRILARVLTEAGMEARA